MGAIPRFRSVVAGALVSGLVESSSFALFAGGPSVGALSDALLVVSYTFNGQWLGVQGCERVGNHRLVLHGWDFDNQE